VGHGGLWCGCGLVVADVLAPFVDAAAQDQTLLHRFDVGRLQVHPAGGGIGDFVVDPAAAMRGLFEGVLDQAPLPQSRRKLWGTVQLWASDRCR
jgi:hypothetical protein